MNNVLVSMLAYLDCQRQRKTAPYDWSFSEQDLCEALIDAIKEELGLKESI